MFKSSASFAALSRGLVPGLLFTLSAFASEGDGKGNGGVVVICPGKPPELLDLAERGWLQGFRDSVQLRTSAASAKDLLEDAYTELAKINADVAEKVRTRVSSIQAAAVPVDAAEFQPFSGDTGLVDLPRGCHLENAIYYRSKEAVQKRVDLIQQLSPLHQAALWIHEGIYRVAIESYGPAPLKDSLIPRRITLALFSTFANRESILSAMVWQNLTVPGMRVVLQLDPARLTAGENLKLRFCRSFGWLAASVIGSSLRVGDDRLLFRKTVLGGHDPCSGDEALMSQILERKIVFRTARELANLWMKPIQVSILYEGSVDTYHHYSGEETVQLRAQYAESGEDLIPSRSFSLPLREEQYVRKVRKNGKRVMSTRTVIHLEVLVLTQRAEDFLNAKPEAFLE